MGKYFDFSPVKPYAGGLDAVFNGLSEGLDDRRKAEREKQSADSYKEQVNAQKAAIEQKKYHDDIAFQQAQEDRDFKLSQEATKAAGSGRLGEAQAYAAMSGFVDPRTHQRVGGVSLTPDDPGPAPVAPVAPAAPEMLPDRPEALPNVQVMTPDQARTQAMGKILGGRTQPPAPGSAEELMAKAAGEEAAGLAERVQRERGLAADDERQNEAKRSAYNTQNAQYDIDQAKYGGAVKEYERKKAHPDFTIGVGGKSIHYNPDEARQAKLEEGQQTAALLRRQAASPDIPVEVRRQMLTAATTIEAQLPAAAAGAITNAQSQSNAHEFTGHQGDLNRTNAKNIAAGNNRATVEAARLRGQAGGIFPNKDERPVIKELQDNLNDVRGKGGLREQIQHQERSLNIIGNDPENPTNWTNLVDAMIRSATGKAAILNQYTLYTGHAAGSLDDAVNQMKERLMTGGLSDAQKANLYASAQASYNETVNEWNDAASTGEEYYQDPRVQASPGVKSGVDRTLHSVFRGGKRKPRTETTVPGRPNVPLSGQPAPAGPPATTAPAPPPAAAHAPGETREVYKDGKKITLVKVGPNNWQPQAGRPAP